MFRQLFAHMLHYWRFYYIAIGIITFVVLFYVAPRMEHGGTFFMIGAIIVAISLYLIQRYVINQ